jgi:hypothetical protein
VSSFDRLDHQVMLKTLGEKIRDNRFLRLVGQMLRAGYLEDWVWHVTLSGAPQGGLCSAEHNAPYAQYRVMRSSAWNRPWLLGLACRHSA